VQDMVDNSTEDDVQSEAVLGAFQKVRFIASKAKIDATVSMARSILETESSIVIFTFFVDVAKEVQKKLRDIGWNGEVLAGDVPPTKRQAMVDKFQSGVTPVFIATFGAGGGEFY
jgi:SNF2 family DNA or RNA helicase